MSRADEDCYFEQSGEIARMLDADPVPRNRTQAERLIEEFQGELRSDTRTRTFRDLVLDAPPRSIREAPIRLLLMRASVDLMPDFARSMHGLDRPLAPGIVRHATLGVAKTLRWAFEGERYRRSA
jgi:uncharacterized protein (DUF2236 family)